MLEKEQIVIAIVFGVGRKGVSEAAGRLQDAGIIKYQWGLMQVLNQPRFEQQYRECYEIVGQENERSS